MIHVIVGDGKGKTTAAVDQCVRAAGHGWKVLFVQFLKDDSSGEVCSLQRLGIETLHCAMNYGFLFQMNEEQKLEIAGEYQKMMEKAIASSAQLIVLDEVIHAINEGLVTKEQIEDLFNKDAEIIFTGRDAPEWLIHHADYISNVQKIRHPYDDGLWTREGIEF